MSVSVTGKLSQAAHQFQAGDSTGYGVSLGVRFYNRETKSQEYTNYEAVIFAKPGNQAEFYAGALVKGSVIEISGSGCQIKTFQGKNGPKNSIAILDAKLGYVEIKEQPAAAPQAALPTIEEFDADIPF